MAVIPIYNRQFVGSGGLNAPKQSGAVDPNAFRGAAPLLEEGGKLGQVFAKIELKKKEEADEAWTSSALAELATRYDDYTFGTEEAPGVFARKGADAMGATKTARDDLQKHADEISKKAVSERAARLFNDKAFDIRSSTARSIARHESAETEAWKLQARADNVVAQTNRIAVNYGWTPEEVEAEFTKTVVPDLNEVAKRKGVPAEQLIAANKARLVSDIITQHLAAGDTEAATERMNRWQSDLTAEQRPRLTAAVKTKRAELDGQAMAEELFHNPAVSYGQAMKDIMAVEDPAMRQHARSLYNAYRYNQKQIESEEYTDKTNDAYTTIDNMVGDLVNQQKFVDAMSTDTANQRKVHDKARARLNQYKAAKGLKPMTDPAAFDSAVESILLAKVNDAKTIRAEFGDKVAAEDIKELETMLGKSQKVTAESMRTAYSFAVGSNGEPDIKLSDSEKKDRGAFMLWAQQMAKDTNRAQDEGYMQQLADKWVLKGERKRAWTPGYGVNASFGEALRTGSADKWLPNQPDEATTNQIKSLLQSNPDVKAQWLKAYDGDEDLAVRAYYKKLILTNIGPRTEK